MRELLPLALRRDVVRRGLLYAVVVGPILIAINHIDAVARGDVDAIRLAKTGLTLAVPYLVSTFSSLGAMAEREQALPPVPKGDRPDGG